jgi:hypothetical protein
MPGRLLTLIEKRAGHWLANEVEQAKIALRQQNTARGRPASEWH